MITIYTFPQTRATRAIWMLEEAGVDYRMQRLDIRDEDARSDAGFRRASPMGKVPAIVDGEVAMAESAAICLYVADRYASGRLAPAIDDPARGRFLYWLMFTPAVMEPAMAEAFGTAEANRVSHGWGDFASMREALSGALEQSEWIMGDNFSAADVMLGSSIYFMTLFGIMPDDPVLAGYGDRCTARPAFQRANAANAPTD